MDDLDQKIDILEQKIDGLQHSIDKMRKLFLWTVLVSVALFILPLMGLTLVIPQFLSIYSSVLQ